MITFTSTIDTSDTLTIDNPKFGDSNTINFKRINRTSRGNDIIIAGEQGWTPTELIKFDWDYLLAEQIDKFKAFVSRNTGYPVTLVDHYGKTHTVVFLRPDAEFSQVGRDNRSVTIDMQKVP